VRDERVEIRVDFIDERIAAQSHVLGQRTVLKRESNGNASARAAADRASSPC